MKYRLAFAAVILAWAGFVATGDAAAQSVKSMVTAQLDAPPMPAKPKKPWVRVNSKQAQESRARRKAAMTKTFEGGIYDAAVHGGKNTVSTAASKEEAKTTYTTPKAAAAAAVVNQLMKPSGAAAESEKAAEPDTAPATATENTEPVEETPKTIAAPIIPDEPKSQAYLPNKINKGGIGAVGGLGKVGSQ